MIALVTERCKKVMLGGLTIAVWKTPPCGIDLVESVFDNTIERPGLLDGLRRLKRQGGYRFMVLWCPLFERSSLSSLGVYSCWRPDPFQAIGSGTVLSDRTGDSRTQRKASEPPTTAIAIAGLSPSIVPSIPPAKLPAGIVPHTIHLMDAFIRPCSRKGTIACRRLTWLTL